jgi:hypothetical protein
MAELRIVCTTKLKIEIYQPTTFHVDISYIVRVMFRIIFFLKRGDKMGKI